MKKLFTIVCTLVLGCAMSFAQGGAGSKGFQNPPAGGSTDTKTTGTTKTKSGKKAKSHKGGKKSKKSSGEGTTTPPPK
jgi:hypothetical protein